MVVRDASRPTFARIGLCAMIAGGPRCLVTNLCPYWPLCHDQWSADLSRDLPFVDDLPVLTDLLPKTTPVVPTFAYNDTGVPYLCPNWPFVPWLFVIAGPSRPTFAHIGFMPRLVTYPLPKLAFAPW